MFPWLGKLTAVAEFERLHMRLNRVEGFLNRVEGYALFLLAAEGPGEGEIVEVGSFKGLSTAWLAAGSRGAGREKVTAVDHFHGSPEHQPGAACATAELAAEGTTFNVFQRNLREVELDAQVTPIVADSATAAADWDRPIRLLFIDGDHSYEATRTDFAVWFPFVIEGGIIAFHDIGNAPGSTRFYEALLETGRAVEEVCRVMSLGVTRKCAGRPR